MEKNTSSGNNDIVKIIFQDEVRKYRNITSYNSLILAIARTMGYGVLNCRFIYVDDDKDEITVSNEEDLAEAFNFFNPKPPRLQLATYDQQVDMSLSQVKLCDSILMDESPNCEIVDNESESESNKELKISTCSRPQEKEEKSFREFEVLNENNQIIEKQPIIDSKNSSNKILSLSDEKEEKLNIQKESRTDEKQGDIKENNFEPSKSSQQINDS